MLRGFTRAIAATTTKRATPTSAKTGLFARKNHSAAANSVSTSASKNIQIIKLLLYLIVCTINY
jgi:hypothetical protein